MKAFLKIERCGEVFSVRSEKAEQGTISKRVVTLDIHPKDIIYGELRFQTHDHNEQTYQDITLVNFVKLGNEEN